MPPHQQSPSAPSPGNTLVRDANEADMAAVERIYSHHVLHGLATFEEIPPSVHEMMSRRISVLAAGLPYLVAEHDGEVVGYSYATSFRTRSGYRYTIEDSVYVAEGLGGKGIGSALLEELIARCERGLWRRMIAVIGDSGNTASIAVHRRFGFQHAGILPSSGLKLGRWVDVVLMQRPLGVGDRNLPTDSPPQP
ncbi:MAG TPA: GNAT family N-acetyltransferase [Steroidobacteraceae bacterium]|nr:GNAT family N-acetyltransferase [Steroidobacteraceae bacterium]